MAPALLVTILLVLGVATAAAQNVPPGVSGANQYTETLPGPGGNSAAGGGNSSGGGTGAPNSAAQTLGTKNARKLESLGADGKAAAALATESAPTNAKPKQTGHRGGKQTGKGPVEKTGASSSGTATSNAQGSSGVEQVLGQITGTGGSNSGGMNWLLPLLIGASVVVAATYVFARHRPARPQD
jgi:hypothetical protein